MEKINYTPEELAEIDEMANEFVESLRKATSENEGNVTMQQAPLEMRAKDVFKKVLTDAVKNIIFFGVGALVIAFIGNALSFRMAGLILAGIFTFIVLLSLIPFLFSFLMGLVAGFFLVLERIKGNKNDLGEQGYLWAGTSVQLIENTICLLYVLYLYRAFF